MNMSPKYQESITLQYKLSMKNELQLHGTQIKKQLMRITIPLPRSMKAIDWITAARMDNGWWLHVTSIGCAVRR
jgi:hypothetical protein